MLMNVLSEWFNQLDPVLKMYWGVAIFASIVVLLQTCLSFIGTGDVDTGDVDVDFDADTDADADSLDHAGAMHLFSIRNVFYFLLGFGWTGVSFWNTIPDHAVLCAVAVLVGCIFVGIFLFIYRQMMKLQSNGAFDINDSVGRVCDVYLRIPAKGQGLGKVQISFNGSVQELDARSSGEQIPTGAKVQVVRVIDKKVLEVEPV